MPGSPQCPTPPSARLPPVPGSPEVGLSLWRFIALIAESPNIHVWLHFPGAWRFWASGVGPDTVMWPGPGGQPGGQCLDNCVCPRFLGEFEKKSGSNLCGFGFVRLSGAWGCVFKSSPKVTFGDIWTLCAVRALSQG